MQAGLKCDQFRKNAAFALRQPTLPRAGLAGKRAGMQQDGERISMQPTDDFNPSRLAKSLLRKRRQGALATLMAGTGAPYCSLVDLASHPDGSPILLISQLAVHTQNILADDRISLMLDERGPGDPLEGARIMLAGRAEVAADDNRELPRRRHLHAH